MMTISEMTDNTTSFGLTVSSGVAFSESAVT